MVESTIRGLYEHIPAVMSDHPIVRKGLLSAVEADSGIRVIAEAQNGERKRCV